LEFRSESANPNFAIVPRIMPQKPGELVSRRRQSRRQLFDEIWNVLHDFTKGPASKEAGYRNVAAIRKCCSPRFQLNPVYYFARKPLGFDKWNRYACPL
jgi:hypothetical protein